MVWLLYSLESERLTKLILLVSRRPGGGGERHKCGPSQSSDLPFAWRDSKG